MRVDKIADFINHSKVTQKILRSVSDNPALASAGISFVAASIIRPFGQAALPIKDDKDKKYTIASSIATGVTDLLFAAAIFIPANKLIQKTSKELYSSTKNTIYKENSQLLRSYKSLSNRFLKVLTLPGTSWLRFAMVAPFVKLLFGKKGPTKVADKGGKINYEG